MQFNRDAFREFESKDEASEWGKEHYSDWLPELQNQDYTPQTSAEKFFRRYTGTSHIYNDVLRYNDINTYDFTDSNITKDEIIEGSAEINRNLLSENILVYRYVSKKLLKIMKEWSNLKLIKHNSILTDKGFFSTTLSLDSVTGRGYAQNKNSRIFKIYVPKGTPCVYVGLLFDTNENNENEVLFAPDIKLKVLVNHWLNRRIECVVVND